MKLNSVPSLLLLILFVDASFGFVFIRIGLRFRGRFRFGKRAQALLPSKQIGTCPYLPCNFDVFDGNNDGKMSPYEFEDYLAKMSFNDENLSVFKELDENRDSIVDKAEFNKRAQKISEGNPIVFPDCKLKNGTQ